MAGAETAILRADVGNFDIPSRLLKGSKFLKWTSKDEEVSTRKIKISVVLTWVIKWYIDACFNFKSINFSHF